MRRLLLLLLAIGLTLPACPEELPPGDAGDAAWAQRAALFLLGRRVLDLDEVDVLTAAVEQQGRADVARAMASTDEARIRWGDFLYDHLYVNRLDARSSPTCYGEPLLPPSTALAEHIARNPPSVPFGEGWGVADVLASSLLADDLGPLYRVNLYYALPGGIIPLNLTEGRSFRRDLGEIFTSTYLGRNQVCLPCHNSEYSVTGSDDPELDRTWELPGHVEKALFAHSEGRDPEDLYTLFRRKGVVAGFAFAQDPPVGSSEDVVLYSGCEQIDGFAGCAGCACEEAVCAEMPECCAEEWGQACSQACFALSDGGCEERPLPEGFEGCGAVLGVFGTGCGGCACEEAVCGADSYCCEGQWDPFCAAACIGTEGSGCELDTEDTVQPWGPSPGCALFVDPATLEPDLSGHSGYFGGGRGPEGSIWDVEALLDEGLRAVSGRVLSMNADGDVPAGEAFAWLAAVHLADAVWEEAFGAPLTVAHGFPRNRPQRDRLARLAGTVTMSGFGLRELLVAVATDDLFNQGSPAEIDGAEPYGLEPVIDPFSVQAEIEAQRGNGVGDLVHPLPPRVQLRAAEQALGWPPAKGFPESPSEPRALVLQRIGGFVKDTAPGFDGIGFQSLLGWEGGMGKCRIDGAEDDYVRRLLRVAQGTPWRRAIVALKERLVTEVTLTSEEVDALEAFLRVDLDDDVGPAGEDVLRRACGALLASPQFLLDGLPPPIPAARPDVLRVDGVSAAGHCRTWQARIDGLTCPEESPE
jgi:hypothetical protein